MSTTKQDIKEQALHATTAAAYSLLGLQVNSEDQNNEGGANNDSDPLHWNVHIGLHQNGRYV